jgi:hypothetical protein
VVSATYLGQRASGYKAIDWHMDLFRYTTSFHATTVQDRFSQRPVIFLGWSGVRESERSLGTEKLGFILTREQVSEVSNGLFHFYFHCPASESHVASAAVELFHHKNIDVSFLHRCRWFMRHIQNKRPSSLCTSHPRKLSVSVHVNCLNANHSVSQTISSPRA